MGLLREVGGAAVGGPCSKPVAVSAVMVGFGAEAAATSVGRAVACVMGV